MKHMDINNFNTWAKNHITDENRFDKDGYIIMKNQHDYKSTGIIAQIFEDHFSNFYAKYHLQLDELRPNANSEVQKIIDCSNHNLGASVYVCTHCSEVFFCHHTCKGKLCSSCGIKTQKIVSENILETCIHCKHRHITFTIPFDLTHWFFRNLRSTDILFEAVNITIHSIVNGKIKKGRIYSWNYSPGFFAFLHTFGRPLNFNPHIHVIIAEQVVSKSKKLKKFDYFNYNALSKRFMKILLDLMDKYFGKQNFKKTKNDMYLKYKNGFYVNNKLEDDGYKFHSIEDLIRYVTRYCSRPVIAESRILSYDGENVTYFYSDHKHEEYHEVTESAFTFISKILRHLLPSNFKSIRSYGFYNKSSMLDDFVIPLVPKEKIPFRKFLLKWTNSILTSFSRIPIKCPNCDSLMELAFEVS